MPKITLWKLFLIACIAGFAAAAVSIGHAEKTDTIVRTNVAANAPRTALPMCPSAQGQMSKPARPTYQRYLGQTPMTRVVVR
jgi:hypothetical protein